MLKVKDTIIRKILNSTDIIVFTILAFVFIAPFFEKHILFLKVVRNLGYLNVVLISMLIFFLLHFTLAYKYDSVIFEKYYSKQKIIHGLILIIGVLFIVFNLIL